MPKRSMLVPVLVMPLFFSLAASAGPAKDRPASPGKSPAQEKGVRSEYPEIESLLEQHNYPEALAAASAASTAEPDNAAAHFYLGLANFYLSKDAEALAAFNRSIELNPGRARPWFFRGLTR